MGFIRTMILLGTGGTAPIKARSYRERTAKATEQLVRLQEQQLSGTSRSASAQQVAAVRPAWFVVYDLGEDRYQVASMFGEPLDFSSPDRAQRWLKKEAVKTPTGKRQVIDVKLVETDLKGRWQLTYEVATGESIPSYRFAIKDDAVMVGKGTWKIRSGNSFRNVVRWRVTPVPGA